MDARTGMVPRVELEPVAGSKNADNIRLTRNVTVLAAETEMIATEDASPEGETGQRRPDLEVRMSWNRL